MCLYPKLINNRKFTANKKNGGIIPPLPLKTDGSRIMVDERVKLVPVGCGKCMECMKKKAREWQVRLLEEVREGKKGHFITLTFSNESIKELSKDIKLEGYERDNEIAKIAMRRFLERWRKKYKKSIRHWMVTELGHNGTKNIHMHGIMWTDKPKEEINNIWGYGYTWIGEYINEKTVNYITKYIHKIDKEHKEYKPKILTSAGIGAGYIKRIDSEKNEYKGKFGIDTNEAYRTRTGHRMAMPIYYRNKIYNDAQRQELWLNKLDEETRYVNGREIKINKGEENYYKALEEARKINEQLGYGNNEKNWDRIRYENERRNINYKKRKGI